MRAWTIGRSRNADVVLTDASVSRSHAELVETDDGRYYLTDCGSSFGTFVQGEGDAWKRVRQDYVEPDDHIRLGEYEITVTELLALAGDEPRRLAAQSALQPKPTETLSETSDLPSGPVERDPLTGKIIRRHG